MRLPPLQDDRRVTHPRRLLAAFLDAYAGRTLALAESAGRRETLAELFAEQGLRPELAGDWAGLLSANPGEGEAEFFLLACAGGDKL